MFWKPANEIAERIRADLIPFCERCEIAGSIRRRKPVVGDIEIVAIPKLVPAGLFGTEFETSPGFCGIINRWPAVKGDPTGKYTQRLLGHEIKLDIFMADFENWGLGFAIRTGSAKFSHEVLARGWVKAGYHSMDGHLVKGFHKIPVPEEQDLFRLINIPWTEPEKRNLE